MKHAALKVDVAASDCLRDQDKPRQMLARIRTFAAATIALASPPCSPDQMRGLLSRQPSVTRFRHVGQHRAELLDRAPNLVPQGVVDCRRKVFNLSSGSRKRIPLLGILALQ
ncbi:hypothetical protein ACFFWD_32835 [Bradyrhizobium erythrophlei]|uniref:hypothetical protein n=1 Tax=Bradyrhizobium erythrophlei TaxID=1437360 RepID=UPI0035E7F5B2